MVTQITQFSVFSPLWMAPAATAYLIWLPMGTFFHLEVISFHASRRAIASSSVELCQVLDAVRRYPMLLDVTGRY